MIAPAGLMVIGNVPWKSRLSAPGASNVVIAPSGCRRKPWLLFNHLLEFAFIEADQPENSSLPTGHPAMNRIAARFCGPITAVRCQA